MAGLPEFSRLRAASAVALERTDEGFRQGPERQPAAVLIVRLAQRFVALSQDSGLCRPWL